MTYEEEARLAARGHASGNPGGIVQVGIAANREQLMAAAPTTALEAIDKRVGDQRELLCVLLGRLTSALDRACGSVPSEGAAAGGKPMVLGIVARIEEEQRVLGMTIEALFEQVERLETLV